MGKSWTLYEKVDGGMEGGQCIEKDKVADKDFASDPLFWE